LVHQLNPTGDPSSYGALTKGGGHHIDGYSEDALVTNGNPNDLRNVRDIVANAGTSQARLVWPGLVERRASDRWEAPRPLGAAELEYLVGAVTPPTPKPNPGEAPKPNPPTPVPPAPAPPVDLSPVLAELTAVRSALREAQADRDLLRAQFAALAERVEAAHVSVLAAVDLGRQMLANPPVYKGGLLGIPVTLRPERP
jgi:hypothetical protein